MSDAKNWIFLIILLNLLSLPVMWLRQGSAVPQVLGESEKIEVEQKVNSTSTNDLISSLNENLWGNSETAFTNKSPALDTSKYNLDLPTRGALTQTNPEEGIRNLRKATSAINIQGKISLREGFKSDLAVKDAQIGDRVRITCPFKTLEYTVDTTALIPDGIIAIGSNQIFALLEVDTNLNKDIDCNITKIN